MSTIDFFRLLTLASLILGLHLGMSKHAFAQTPREQFNSLQKEADSWQKFDALSDLYHRNARPEGARHFSQKFFPLFENGAGNLNALDKLGLARKHQLRVSKSRVLLQLERIEGKKLGGKSFQGEYGRKFGGVEAGVEASQQERIFQQTVKLINQQYGAFAFYRLGKGFSAETRVRGSANASFLPQFELAQEVSGQIQGDKSLGLRAQFRKYREIKNVSFVPMFEDRERMVGPFSSRLRLRTFHVVQDGMIHSLEVSTGLRPSGPLSLLEIRPTFAWGRTIDLPPLKSRFTNVLLGVGMPYASWGKVNLVGSFYESEVRKEWRFILSNQWDF